MTAKKESTGLIRAISPKEVEVCSRPSDEAIEYLNKELARSWSRVEAKYGRSICFSDLPRTDMESVVEFYRQAGWEIREEEGRDGYYLRFFLGNSQRSQS